MALAHRFRNNQSRHTEIKYDDTQMSAWVFVSLGKTEDDDEDGDDDVDEDDHDDDVDDGNNDDDDDEDDDGIFPVSEL